MRKAETATKKSFLSLLGVVAALGVATPMLTGCPAVIGVTAVTAVSSAIDRRTVGIQVEDRTIQLKAIRALNEQIKEGTHINVTVYNRKILMTGEAINDDLRRQAGSAVANIENVRSIVNDIQVAGISSMTSRSNDTLITGKVKAAFLEDEQIEVSAVKVTTEAGVVYLMGLVTRTESDLIAGRASRVSGVKKVVKAFDYLSQEELNQIKANAEKSR